MKAGFWREDRIPSGYQSPKTATLKQYPRYLLTDHREPSSDSLFEDIPAIENLFMFSGTFCGLLCCSEPTISDFINDIVGNRVLLKHEFNDCRNSLGSMQSLQLLYQRSSSHWSPLDCVLSATSGCPHCITIHADLRSNCQGAVSFFLLGGY